MGYLDTYRSRLNAYGNSSQDSIMTDSKSMLDGSIDNSPLKSTIQINGIDINVLVTQGKNDNYKNVVFKSSANYQTGDIATIDGYKWLFMEVNQTLINKTASVRLCNSTLTIPGDTTKTIVGYDEMGRPIYDETTSPSTTLPCIAESKVYMSQDQEPINLPNGRLVVTVPYTNNDKIKLNFEFDMYGNGYEVSHVDSSQVIGTVGILQLTADLVQGG
jgi:hypothetical protein